MVNSKNDRNTTIKRVSGSHVIVPLKLSDVVAESTAPRKLFVHGLEQAGPSYRVHVFIGNEAATVDTPRTEVNGFVGTIPIFGYGNTASATTGNPGSEANSPMARELALPGYWANRIQEKANASVTFVPVYFGADASAEDVFLVSHAEIVGKQ